MPFSRSGRGRWSSLDPFGRGGQPDAIGCKRHMPAVPPRTGSCQNGQRPAGDQEPLGRVEPVGSDQGRSAWRKAAEITEQIRGTGSAGTGSEGTARGREAVSAAQADTDTANEVEPIGHFRIYLGAAPGVGKTYAMLSEGQRRRQRGADVVAAFVETYGRPHTAALLNGLEIIPRKVVDYRGTRLEEMDLDAVLRRRPEVALIDELAHTNVPGSAGTTNAGRMSRRSSPRASRSSRPSTSSTWRASRMRSSRSPGHRYMNGYRTGWCGRPTRPS